MAKCYLVAYHERRSRSGSRLWTENGIAESASDDQGEIWLTQISQRGEDILLGGEPTSNPPLTHLNPSLRQDLPHEQREINGTRAQTRKVVKEINQTLPPQPRAIQQYWCRLASRNRRARDHTSWFREMVQSEFGRSICVKNSKHDSILSSVSRDYWPMGSLRPSSNEKQSVSVRKPFNRKSTGQFVD